jgi:hypothetical protein
MLSTCDHHYGFQYASAPASVNCPFRFAENALIAGDRMTAACGARLAAVHRMRHDCRNGNKGRKKAACRQGGFR